MLDPLESTENDTKTVSIKGVDSHLYAHYMELVKLSSTNSGTHFSHIIDHYLHFIKPGPIISHSSKGSIRYEIIENIEELSVGKADFGTSDLKIKYIFKNIKHLHFDETVSTEILKKYVQAIYDSKVTSHNEISNLILNSIDQSNRRQLQTSGELKDVTIRNVNISIYEEFVALCHKENITIGGGISKMLREMIPRMEISEIARNINSDYSDNVIIISMKEDFEVSETDLKEISDSLILFHRIRNLKFFSDISLDFYIKTVVGVYNCTKVEFPESFPQLMKLSQKKNFP